MAILEESIKKQLEIEERMKKYIVPQIAISPSIEYFQNIDNDFQDIELSQEQISDMLYLASNANEIKHREEMKQIVTDMSKDVGVIKSNSDELIKKLEVEIQKLESIFASNEDMAIVQKEILEELQKDKNFKDTFKEKSLEKTAEELINIIVKIVLKKFHIEEMSSIIHLTKTIINNLKN